MLLGRKGDILTTIANSYCCKIGPCAVTSGTCQGFERSLPEDSRVYRFAHVCAQIGTWSLLVLDFER